MILVFGLIFMFFLGCVQVIWAIIHSIATAHARVRNHFLYYLGGVVMYFVILFMLGWGGDDRISSPVFLIHFFGSAGALCSYHIYIVLVALKVRRAASVVQSWA